MKSTILQDQLTNASSTVTDGEPVEKTLSVIELIFSSGLAGQIIIAILFVLLIAAVYIYFERIFAIKEASKIDSNFMNQIKDYVTNGVGFDSDRAFTKVKVLDVTGQFAVLD